MWRHQAITWTNVDLSSISSCGIHFRAISQISVLDLSLKIINSKYQPHLPGTNKLTTVRIVTPAREGHVGSIDANYWPLVCHVVTIETSHSIRMAKPYFNPLTLRFRKWNLVTRGWCFPNTPGNIRQVSFVHSKAELHSAFMIIVPLHDDVIKWKHFLCQRPFVQGIHRSSVNSPYKGQWHGALIFSLICAWTNRWANNWITSDLRRHHTHYDVTVMKVKLIVNHSWLLNCDGQLKFVPGQMKLSKIK